MTTEQGGRERDGDSTAKKQLVPVSPALALIYINCQTDGRNFQEKIIFTEPERIFRQDTIASKS